MVGTKSSGNRQPSNNARLSLTSELMDFLDSTSIANKKGIPREFLICLGFLERHKEAFVAMFDEETYEEHIKRYSRNRTEMRRETQIREEEKQKKAEERLKLKREEQELKRRELDIRVQNSDLRSDKRKDEEITDLTEELADVKHQIKSLRRNAQRYGKTDRNALQDLEIRKTTIEKRLEELSK